MVAEEAKDGHQEVVRLLLKHIAKAAKDAGIAFYWE